MQSKRKIENEGRRDFLKYLGLTAFSVATFGCTPRLSLREGEIKEKNIYNENPKNYRVSSNVKDYLNSRFDIYTTQDEKVLVFDDLNDNYIFKPSEEKVKEMKGENIIHKIGVDEAKRIAVNLEEEVYFLDKDDMRVNADIVPCSNPEGVVKDIISYKFGSPKKRLVIGQKKLGREYEFKVFDFDPVQYGGGNGGDSSGDNGGPSGGAGGSGGDGAGGAGGSGGGGAR